MLGKRNPQMTPTSMTYMTKPNAVAKRPENDQGGLGRQSHRKGRQGHDGRQNPVDPDLLGMAGLLPADVAPIHIAQQMVPPVPM
jgi:hypothetical protein